MLHMLIEDIFNFFLLQKRIFKTLENDPVFARQPGEDVPMEKMRELTFLRYRRTEEKLQRLDAVSHLS